jgi:T-complex protein 11
MEAAMSDDNDLMRSLDPALIHKVLLTDSEEFSSLSSSVKTRFTMSFTEFKECLDSDPGEMDQDMVLKKAVWDHMTNNQPLHLDQMSSLLCDLHQQIRALIPNRKDLHSILEDDKARTASTLSDLQPLIMKAARSLLQLESESRGTTTVALLDQLQQAQHKDALFWMTAIFYLLYKAELCEGDKQDFYLVNVWAPRIHKEGPAYEKAQYQKQYGNFNDLDSSPATRQWINDLVQSHLAANPQARHEDPSRDSIKSVDDRKKLIRAGWVEDIVFREADQRVLKLPEIFARDRHGLETLREMTRLAVAGCSLALQACSVAGLQQQLLSNPECTSQERKLSLLRAMRCRGIPVEVYEKNVVEEVKELAREWSIHFGTKEINEEVLEQLGWRVVAILRGQDPVLKLLNNRAKKTVLDVLVHNLDTRADDVTVSEMHTGVLSRLESSNNSADQRSGMASPVLEKLFCQRGLAFFSSELAIVSKLAGRVVNLAIDLYWDEFLDKLVLDACASGKHST